MGSDLTTDHMHGTSPYRPPSLFSSQLRTARTPLNLSHLPSTATY